MNTSLTRSSQIRVDAAAQQHPAALYYGVCRSLTVSDGVLPPMNESGLMHFFVYSTHHQDIYTCFFAECQATPNRGTFFLRGSTHFQRASSRASGEPIRSAFGAFVHANPHKAHMYTRRHTPTCVSSTRPTALLISGMHKHAHRWRRKSLG